MLTIFLKISCLKGVPALQLGAKHFRGALNVSLSLPTLKGIRKLAEVQAGLQQLRLKEERVAKARETLVRIKRELFSEIEKQGLTGYPTTSVEEGCRSLRMIYDLLVCCSRAGVATLGLKPEYFHDTLSLSFVLPTLEGIRKLAAVQAGLQQLRLKEEERVAKARETLARIKRELFSEIEKQGLTGYLTTFVEEGGRSLRMIYNLLVCYSRTGVASLGLKPKYFCDALNPSFALPTPRGIRKLAVVQAGLQQLRLKEEIRSQQILTRSQRKNKAGRKSGLIDVIKRLGLTEKYPTDPDKIDGSLKKGYGLLLYLSRQPEASLEDFSDTTKDGWITVKGFKKLAEFHAKVQQVEKRKLAQKGKRIQKERLPLLTVNGQSPKNKKKSRRKNAKNFSVELGLERHFPDGSVNDVAPPPLRSNINGASFSLDPRSLGTRFVYEPVLFGEKRVNNRVQAPPPSSAGRNFSFGRAISSSNKRAFSVPEVTLFGGSFVGDEDQSSDDISGFEEGFFDNGATTPMFGEESPLPGIKTLLPALFEEEEPARLPGIESLF